MVNILVLCLLACPQIIFGWSVGTRYEYKVEAQGLTDGNDPNTTTRGLTLKSNVFVWPRSENILNLRVFRLAKSALQQKTEAGRWVDFPENQRNYPALNFTDPFQVRFEDHAINRLVLHSSTQNTAAKFFMEIASIFQVNMEGKNRSQSDSDDQFSIMESSAYGKCETRYNIIQLTEQEVNKSSLLSSLRNLSGSEVIHMVVKKVDFGKCQILANQSAISELAVPGFVTFDSYDSVIIVSGTRENRTLLHLDSDLTARLVDPDDEKGRQLNIKILATLLSVNE